MATVKAKGIDVSKHNGTVDFAKVKADGYDFVIIRAGYGKVISQKDPMFETHYKNAKAAGLGVGAYWYSYATTKEEAMQEASVCSQVINGKQLDYPVFFDMEEDDTFAKGKATCSEIVKAFCGLLEKAGYFTGLYMSRSALSTYITDDVQKAYVLWVAEWGSACNYAGRGTLGMWQHSSTGSVSGVSGNVDLNQCYVDYPTIIRKGGYNGYKNAATTSAAAKPTTSTGTTGYAKGAKITLSNATLYASATATKGTKKSGIYYIYDGEVTNGRMRITNSAANVGKTPIGTYVTGWVKKTDIK